MARNRVRHTCTECSRRRQQCDRNVPCARCIKRGVPEKCQLSWPRGQYDSARDRVYPSRRRTLSSQPLQDAHQSPTEVSSIVDGDASPIPGLLPSLQAGSSGSSQARETWQHSTPTAARPRYVFTPFEPVQVRRHDQLGEEHTRSLGLGHQTALHEKYLQTLLPSVEHIWKLVDYSEQWLLWFHCSYHGPSFRSELESLIAEQQDKTSLDVSGLEMQWIALLFSIMAGSLMCSAEWRLREWGFSRSETVQLSIQWYNAAILCLNQGEWTSRHHMRSVQAVTTLTMAAHALGRSDELSILLGTALKIAQALGLHRLRYNTKLDTVEETSSDAQRQIALERDIGRKLWSYLCVQDFMSLPFSGYHNINPAHCTSTKPMSRNYLTMESIPATFPTYISYGNYLFKISKLLVRHNEAMLESTTPFTKYQQVLDFDAKMRDLATIGMPRYFHVVEPIDAMWPEWVDWARSSLTVCFAHKIIMIHHDFIRESFTNPAYAFTRMTCVAAAKTVLTESNRRGAAKNAPIIWIDKAFCVAAALVLCLDIRHRTDSDPELATHRGLVIECAEQLKTFPNSTVAVRGAALLLDIVGDRSRGIAPLGWPLTIRANDLAEKYNAFDPSGTRLTELFPPPTGFSNKFIFENLLACTITEE